MKATNDLDFYAEHMVEVMQNMLEAQAKTLGNEFSKNVAVKFVEKFISVFVYKTLAEKSSKANTPQDKFQHAYKNYANVKYSLQEAIGLAFGASFYAFSGREVDYMCRIQAVPEAPTKEFC